MAWRVDLKRRNLVERESVAPEGRSQGRHVTEAGVPVRRSCDTWSNVCFTAWARRRRRRGGTKGGPARRALASVTVVVVHLPLISPGRSVFVGRLAASFYEFETQKQVSNV